jgi:hypothetical protein
MAEQPSKPAETEGAMLTAINDKTGVYTFIGDDERPWNGTFLKGTPPQVNQRGNISDGPTSDEFQFQMYNSGGLPAGNATFKKA